MTAPAAEGSETGVALVVHPVLRSGRGPAEAGSRAPEAALEEAVGLAAAIGLSVVDRRCVRVNRPSPATLFGGGTVEEIGEAGEAAGADLIVVDAALSPVQQRNLEQAWKRKVIDRTGLILEIFGERARTREGQLQVDLAHLTYQRSRLVRSWTHLERQRGGAGFMGGPGERQIEIDRRLIDERIVRLKKDLEDVTRTRGLHRAARSRVPYPVVALVGYTNAGKSTLFNRLTQADVMARDLLFATLDPTMRQIDLGQGRRVILSDTVGFISDLPTHLVAAFRATLEEVSSADIILHVRDISHPDTEAQRADVVAVLADLEIDAASDPRMVEVLNKVDLLDQPARAAALNGADRHEAEVAVSALTGEGVDALMDLVREKLAAHRATVRLKVRLSDGKAIAWLHDRGEILDRRDDDRFAHLRVRLDQADVARFEQVRDPAR